MTTKASPLKRAIKAAKEAIGPQRYRAHSKDIICSTCKHDRFKQGGYIVILTMHTLVCEDCGHVDFFKGSPKAVET